MGVRPGSTTTTAGAGDGVGPLPAPAVVLPGRPLGPRSPERHVVPGILLPRRSQARSLVTGPSPCPSGATGAPHTPRHSAGLRRTRWVLEPWQLTYPEVEVVADTECASPGRVLVESSVKARLLVLGRRPGDRVAWLGPVAHAVLHHTDCPVAVVPEA
ncbi:universal stress protein [Kitasatospora sp. NPDC093550]|uniref:universal stress protein n=1 Tax=Kitasatospora sp. NPDC093550 TaxID=3364089 RepID=UPI00382D786C